MDPLCSRRDFLRGCAASGLVVASRALPAVPAAAPVSARRIDAHVHFAGDTPGSLRLLDELNLKLFNICVGRVARPGGIDYAAFIALARAHPRHFAWCTGIETPDFGDPAYVDKTLAQLDRDFEDGALACKIWKNIGMEAKDAGGAYLQIDHPVFTPIFAHLERRKKPVLLHMAEPIQAWQKLEPGGVYSQYYARNPQYHLHGRAGVPTHAEIIAARDRVIARHPGLTIVGAHLGSMEHDVAEIAARFERYPNFFVDTSALDRLISLGLQDRDKVRAFVLQYQDRLLFGSDRVLRPGPLSTLSPEGQEQQLGALRSSFSMAENFFTGTGNVQVRDRMVPALGLPGNAAEKIFRLNALRVYPGL